MNKIFRAYLKNFFEFILAPIRQLFAFLSRAMPFLKWLANLKPEVLAAVLTFIFLLVIWIITRFASGEQYAQQSTQWIGWGMQLGVIVLIPVVLYVFLKVLLQPPKSPFPDIDESWNAGLDALAKAGLPIKDLPLYVVLGLKDTKQIRRIMESSGRKFDVEGATGTGQSLIWYGSQDQAYVFLADVGAYTEFSQRSLGQSLVSQTNEQDISATANISQFYQAPVGSPTQPEELDEPIMSTVKAEDAVASSLAASGYAAPQEPASAEPPRETYRAKASKQRKRLNHLCGLARRARQPVSPVNGILINVDVDVLESFPHEMANQLRNDLSGLASELGVTCACTAMVSGMEKDPGFVDFAQRLIQENGAEFGKSKFGRSYRSWSPASAEQLEQIATAAVETFDHFVHLLFTKRDALSAEHIQGNRDLVVFVCRLYGRILPGLQTLLGKGCGTPPSVTEVEFPRFSGCYFVGHDSRHDYFAEKVFERVDETMGELEWTRTTKRREDGWRTLSNLGYLVGLASLIAFAFLWFFHDQPA